VPVSVIRWVAVADQPKQQKKESPGLLKSLPGLAFVFWVFVAVTIAMSYPEALRSWGDFNTTRLIVPLVQIIMLGMGATLTPEDFLRAFRMPKAVVVGIVLQFTVMPLLGASIAFGFGFTAEVAAGVILIGACPAGVASNVINYLAKNNLALSVTMTACSTLVAPVMTPLAMKLLAGQYVPVAFGEMLVSIMKMIILPIVGGLILNRVMGSYARWLRRLLPAISMAAICMVIAVITAHSREQLLTVGVALTFAAMIHNVFGYFFGYWGARMLGLNEVDARTVSVEVGMQNGGMASGLAVNVLRSTDAALAPAIFGPWMNISGSLLASWWGNWSPADRKKGAAAADALKR
jgi:bile acid:Na+ symporter, BASS family